MNKNPKKQHRTGNKATLHVKHKQLQAHLLTNDPDLQTIHTVTMQTNDKIKIIHDDFNNPNNIKPNSHKKHLKQSKNQSKIKTKITNINTKKKIIFVNKITSSTTNNKKKNVPIKPSNLVITSLFKNNPLKIKKLIKKSKNNTNE